MVEDRERRIVMARSIARQWIMKMARTEYRFRVYGTANIKHLSSLLKSLRDGKIAMEGVESISDLGIKDGFDSMEFWSGDHEKLSKLHKWFEKRGYETTGVW